MKKIVKKPKWRINDEIGAASLRVIDEAGKQVGVLSKAEALAKAKEAGVDLVEIAPMAKPPVAKIIDFGKFRYREEKKAQKEKKGAKGGELKEVRLSPFIAQGDYTNRSAKIKGFLADNNKVRVVVKFKGRQMGSKKFGYQLMQRILEELAGTVVIDMEPKFLGRHLAMVISPLSKAKQVEKTKNGSKNETKDKEIPNKAVQDNQDRESGEAPSV